ncbi:MAG: hypothetical protein RL095_284 [Verrucomicrobiota bacterium]|jgi:hypothetical protein
MNPHSHLRDVLASSLADQRTQALTQAAQSVLEDAELLREIGKCYAKVDVDLTQGRFFEVIEVLKFNREAASQQVAEQAFTTASLGQPTAPADILIKSAKTGEVLKEVQAKSYGSAAESVNALRAQKYQGMDLLAPQDQIDKAKVLVGKRANSGSINAPQYQDMDKRLTGELKSDQVASGGTTRSEADWAAEHPKLAALKFELAAIGKECAVAGIQAGASSAVISGGFSAMHNSFALLKGEKDLGAALSDTATLSGKAFATGFSTGAMTKVVGHTARAALPAGAAHGLLKTNAPAAIAAGVVQCSIALGKYIKGDIESEQLLEEVTSTAVNGSFMFYYGALGTALIPIPVLGTLVGSLAGYFISNLFLQSGLVSLGQSQVEKAAAERRRQIEEFCHATILRMREERLQFESLVAEHCAERKVLFDQIFDGMESAIHSNEPMAFVSGLQGIADAFSQHLPFKTFEEFDGFMQDDSLALKL